VKTGPLKGEKEPERERRSQKDYNLLKGREKGKQVLTNVGVRGDGEGKEEIGSFGGKASHGRTEDGDKGMGGIAENQQKHSLESKKRKKKTEGR